MVVLMQILATLTTALLQASAKVTTNMTEYMHYSISSANLIQTPRYTDSPRDMYSGAIPVRAPRSLLGIWLLSAPCC